MADVTFTVQYDFSVPARVLWDELVDWKAHEAWIPMTRVDDGEGDPTSVGHEFVAYTGVGKLALKDHMRVTECTWDDADRRGRCTVDKLGPVLTGEAGFEVEASGNGSRIDWFEDVRVPYVPQFLAPFVGRLGAIGFRQGMKQLDRVLRERSSASA